MKWINTRLLCSALLALSFTIHSQAQEYWSLEKCVAYARQNSLNVKQAQYNVSNAELGLKQSKMNRLPSLNAGVSGGFQLGRTIDPTTNTFDNNSIGFNSYSLDAGIILYNGNSINNGIRQSKIDLQIARYDAEEMANNIGLQVANAYLNIMLSEDQLDAAQNRLRLSEAQLDQTDKLIRAGARPANERLDLAAQYARDEQSVIETRNAVEINYLALKQLLEVDPDMDLRIVRPEINVPAGSDPFSFKTNEVYAVALGNQPGIQANRLRVESAMLSEDIARAGMLPTLTFFASLNSNYSSLSRDFGNPNLDNAQIVPRTPVPVLIDGATALLTEFGLDGITFPRKSYGSQLNENFGQTIGMSLRIPIYNNHRNSIALERSRIGVLNSELSKKQAEQTLKSNVQRAIADARAAGQSWQAAQRSLEAAQTAYDNAQRRYDLGAANSLELANARIQLDLAETSQIQTKYQYIFNLKVVDFYLGRPITLN